MIWQLNKVLKQKTYFLNLPFHNSQVINKPTHISQNFDFNSCIDLLFTNQ